MDTALPVLDDPECGDGMMSILPLTPITLVSPISPKHGTSQEHCTTDDDLFPDTAGPVPDSTSRSTVPEQLEPVGYPDQANNPTLSSREPTSSMGETAVSIPLPPSPPLTPLSTSSMSQMVNRAPSGMSRFSARSVSGPKPLVVKGRAVSGTMQHAMRSESVAPGDDFNFAPTPPIDPSAIDDSQDPTSFPLGTDQSDTEEKDEIDHGEEVEGMGYTVASAQDDEEIWMSYVREQLNTLFPDFFDTPDMSPPSLSYSPDSSADVSIDSVPGSTGQDRDVESDNPLDSENRGWEVIQRGGHRRAWDETRLPNVKREIGGMREEIERLRGLVSGLASQMDTSEETEAAESVWTGEKPSVLPVEFVQTATMSMRLILQLDTLLQGNDRPREAAEVFDMDNLRDLEVQLYARFGVDKLPAINMDDGSTPAPLVSPQE